MKFFKNDKKQIVNDIWVKYMAKLYQMTRNEKMVKSFYFKGKISNKHINIKIMEEKEMNSDFVIAISIIM